MKHNITNLIGKVDSAEYTQLIREADLEEMKDSDESIISCDQSVFFYYDEMDFYQFLNCKISDKIARQIVFFTVAQKYFIGSNQASSLLLAKYLRYFSDQTNCLNIFINFINTSFPLCATILSKLSYEVLRIIYQKCSMDDIEDISYILFALEKRETSVYFPKQYLRKLIEKFLPMIIIKNYRYAKKLLYPKLFSNLEMFPSLNKVHEYLLDHKNFLASLNAEMLTKITTFLSNTNEDKVESFIFFNQAFKVNGSSRYLLEFSQSLSRMVVAGTLGFEYCNNSLASVILKCSAITNLEFYKTPLFLDILRVLNFKRNTYQPLISEFIYNYMSLIFLQSHVDPEEAHLMKTMLKTSENRFIDILWNVSEFHSKRQPVIEKIC